MELDSGAAIVTGAAGGIGSVIADRLARGGMSVVVADLDRTRLEAVAESLAGDHPHVGVVPVVGDVGDPAHHEELVAAADSLGGATPGGGNSGGGSSGGGPGGLRLSVLNAGVSLPGLSWEEPLERWELTTRVNYWGVVHGMRAALRAMVPRADGWVVAISSGAGLVATPGLAPYVATKHAVVGMMESAHHELARIGSPVGVSVVCPGSIATVGADRPAMSGVDAADESAFPDVVGRIQDATREGLESGAEPATVAEALVEGVVNRRFWVLPQPELAWAATDRVRRLAEGGSPADLLG